MSFPRYPKYKASGVEWLGEVPEHWETRRLKTLLSEPLKYGANESAEDENPSHPRFVRITDINDEGGLREDTFKSLPPDVAAPYLLQPGDVLLARSGATVGKSIVCSPDWGIACFAGYLIRARLSTDECLPKWFAYFCQTHTYRDYVTGSQIQATIQNVSAEKYGSVHVPIPPIDEQRLSIAFLDRETTKIDALIAEQQRLIELLQEKRQAVISHAVTKGLNPDVPMKDSGIEWLGEVPKHWEMTRLDRISAFVNGKAHEPFVHDDGQFICVTSRFISTDGEASKMCSENLTPARRGDVLMVMSDLPNGRALARTFHVQDDRAYAINQRVCAIRPLGASPRYLSFLLNRNPWFLQNDDGLNQTHLSVSDFRKMPLVLPPVDEQEAISRHLDRMVAMVTGLVGHAESCITLLQERRCALISAAVTGQIDVRGLAGSEAA